MIYILMAILLSAICGILGGLSGQGYPKALRRWVMPAITTIFSMVVLTNLRALFLMLRTLPLSLGYGIPDSLDPKPSKLGVFWFNIFHNTYKADLATRGTLGLMEALVMLTIPLLTGNWIAYFAIAPIVVFVWVYLGVIKQDEGEFPLFGEQMLWEEVQIHGINTFLYYLLVLLS